ncbi:MAG TPA: CocE/NonD family hydrolase [Pseudomonadota bacterium]|nr:CocE/NonD family hydrolase [Pseudomonadota bacterium]
MTSRFNFTRAMVPMRDGVKLETLIGIPKDAARPLPFLLSRSPYGVPSDEELAKPRPKSALEADGYIHVVQNLRGRFKSEGTFVMQRPPRDRADPRATDESTDAYDTIEWLLHSVPNNNGRAGMIGASYSAWTATMALLDPHPALKAVVEDASPADQFIGDDSHHNGALRLSYCFEYSALLELGKDDNTQFEFDRLDTYEWYLALGPLANVNDRYFHGKLPSWNDLVAHPNRDAFWDKQSFAAHLSKTTVPILNVAGWWDQEDFYGPLKIYELLEGSDAEHRNYLVVGPWNHGGAGGPGRKLADIDFGSDAGAYFRETILARWLGHWLHGQAMPQRPEAEVFVTGMNQWRTFAKWPPDKGITPTKLYLRAGGMLSFAPPTETSADAFDEYVSDPANPVPYTRRPIRPTYQGSEWEVWQLLDQRFVDHRTDVLSWQSEVLDHDVVIAGDLQADLFAATSGTDSDWIVKLIDVYPEQRVAPPKLGEEKKDKDAPADLRGYQLMISGEILRGRFRDSFVRPQPIPAGKIIEYKIGLHTNAHAFLKGHRTMVQVQSTWFPLYDRNPQRYVDSIFSATAADYVKATQRIARSRAAPSAVILPIVTQP